MIGNSNIRRIVVLEGLSKDYVMLAINGENLFSMLKLNGEGLFPGLEYDFILKIDVQHGCGVEYARKTFGEPDQIIKKD